MIDLSAEAKMSPLIYSESLYLFPSSEALERDAGFIGFVSGGLTEPNAEIIVNAPGLQDVVRSGISELKARKYLLRGVYCVRIDFMNMVIFLHSANLENFAVVIYDAEKFNRHFSLAAKGVEMPSYETGGRVLYRDGDIVQVDSGRYSKIFSIVSQDMCSIGGSIYYTDELRRQIASGMVRVSNVVRQARDYPITSIEASERIGVTRKQMIRLKDRNLVKGFLVSRKWIFRHDDIDKYIIIKIRKEADYAESKKTAENEL